MKEKPEKEHIMEKKDIDALREQLKEVYGTAAVSFGLGNNAGPLTELFRVDGLSDEEVLEEAERMGLL